MNRDDGEGSMLDEVPRPKPRHHRGHRVGTLIPWDEIGTTILFAAIAAGVFYWLVHR